MKRNIRQMLPVAAIIAVAFFLSLFLYHTVMKREEAQCWQLLEDSAKSVTKEIQMTFDNDIARLRLAANVMEQEQNLDADTFDSNTLDLFRDHTLFSRIDVLFPEDQVILEDGTRKQLPPDCTFAEILEKGESMSARMVDPESGRNSMYYYMPVEQNGTVAAVLAGVVDAETLKEVFVPSIYDSQAKSCIIDSRDGNFVMDQWHDELGNAYTTPDRTKLKAYENVDLKSEVKAQKTGVIAFVSKTTGMNLYMYYMPISMFDWELQLFVQEDVIFANVLYLRKLLIVAGIVELIFLLIYFAWNLYTVNQLVKSREQLQIISYQDALTQLFNRNKYMQVLKHYNYQTLSKVGVIYLDLNGLKEANDRYGHEAGDALICKAASIVGGIFPEHAYRIGGDEFVVLLWPVTQVEFEQKKQKLLTKMQTQNISISCGALWQENCTDLELLLKDADQRMYADKQRHYKEKNEISIEKHNK